MSDDAVALGTARLDDGVVAREFHTVQVESLEFGAEVLVPGMPGKQGEKGDQGPQGPPGVNAGGYGNLLTPNQALGGAELGGTDGFTNVTGSMAHSTEAAREGSGSIKLTSTATGTRLVVGGGGSSSNGQLAVQPGATYTAVASAMAPAEYPVSLILRIYWYQADKATPASTAFSASGGAAQVEGAWRDFVVTAVAPPDAAYATITFVRGSGGGAGYVRYEDRFGFWRGAGGDWAMPGQPIIADGRRVTRPNGTDRLIEVWSPSDAAWIVQHYDSGSRSVALENGWRNHSNGTAGVVLRRVGNIVTFGGQFTGNAATSTAIYSVPTGFKGYSSGAPLAGLWWWRKSSGGQDNSGLFMTSASVVTTQAAVPLPDSITRMFQMQWLTADPIPTSLPGTNIQSAP